MDHNRNGRRVQITVPHEIAESWEQSAKQTGLSVSSWVIAQVQRQDSLAESLNRLDSRLAETMSRYDSPPDPAGETLLLDDDEHWMLKKIQQVYLDAGHACTPNDAIRMAIRNCHDHVIAPKAPAEPAAALLSVQSS